MDIYIRQAKQGDKQAAIKVEGQSTPNLRYIERLWEDFSQSVDEPLYIAFYQGQIAGIAKFSILADGTGWLECLRVAKKFQSKGLGKAIYAKYIEHAKKLKLKKLRMYTGLANAKSKGLAEINGFSLAGQYRGADLDLSDYSPAKYIAGFSKVDDIKLANKLLIPLVNKWDKSLVINRTFYPYNKAFINSLVAKNMLYYHQESKSIIAYGARFMPERAMNIALMAGDYDLCLDFASYYTYLQSINKLTIMWPHNLFEIEEAVKKHKFITQASDCIVMERKFSYDF